MNFLQTTFLLATAAVAIPVLLHLLNRWQARHIELGTMRFLEEVMREGAQRRKIRRWLLLLTRCSLVLLLAFLFARPFLWQQKPQQGQHVRLILIDRSASMAMKGNAGRLIDDAVSAAAEWSAERRADQTVQWAWFDSQVEPLEAGVTRPSSPQILSGDTNYLAALRWARDRLHLDRATQGEVLLVTDMQQSGLVGESLTDEAVSLPPDVPFHLIDVGRPAANNLAITAVTTPGKRIGIDDELEFKVTLFNYGPLPYEEVPLTVAIASEERTARVKKQIGVAAGQASEVTFAFGKLEPGFWRATVSLDIEDDLAADNRHFAAVQIARPLEVLVLDSGSSKAGTSAESYYLATALQQDSTTPLPSATPENDSPPRLGRFRAVVHYLEDAGVPSIDPATHPLVVVADAGRVPLNAIEKLATYVRAGGKLLIFAGDAYDNDVWGAWEMSGLAPGKLQAPRRSGVMPFRITSVQPGAMLEPFEDPQRSDLSRLRFEKVLPVEADTTTQVWASFDNRQPAVTKHQLQQGDVAWFLASADSQWSNWTTSPLYLPLVQQIAADLVKLTGEGLILDRRVGDQDQTTPLATAINNEPLTPATFTRPGFLPQGEQLVVVNSTSKESDPTRLDKQAFADHFGLKLAGETPDQVDAMVAGQTRKELWPWFAAAGLVLMVFEFALANRTSA
ncbi:hypothetical protein DTL42_18765 [Bremerella cremea]|uniref:Aerotolerance regulator N-terminal domain-containing protein n=1 Tax=Bremerella cremea TaxID=1031537 RepID=A0A368KQ59_9BACT|nr:BatA domain-containing protein [Bremerella cremea]RCS43540.1 hypothetical protein DTL42_18765 [Bremerella cremea]